MTNRTASTIIIQTCYDQVDLMLADMRSDDADHEHEIESILDSLIESFDFDYAHPPILDRRTELANLLTRDSS